MTRKRLIIANWKMTPGSVKEAEEILGRLLAGAPKIKNTEVVICPPFVYLDRFSNKLRGAGNKLRIVLGAQDAFWSRRGEDAYTGEISIRMLKDLGVKYVIIGHSERREHLAETDVMINRKIKAVLRSKLKALLCVGEQERDEAGEYLKFIKRQIRDGLHKIPRKDLANLIIVYEPVWAISTHKKTEADSP
jgi:triosephosphate isomerase